MHRSLLHSYTLMMKNLKVKLREHSRLPLQQKETKNPTLKPGLDQFSRSINVLEIQTRKNVLNSPMWIQKKEEKWRETYRLKDVRNMIKGTPLEVQGVRLHTPNAGGPGSIPGWN